nr:MAG TPA_asm: hypothetical protein [Caudoviricetes sp.]
MKDLPLIMEIRPLFMRTVINVYGLHIPDTKNIRMQTGRFMTQ